MKYYKFWVKEDFDILIDGESQTISILAGSNQSESAAKVEAINRAKQIETRISERNSKESYQATIKEFVHEIINHSNIITICRYGAKILNTTEYTILDLDDYPVDLFDFLKPVGKLSKKERIVFKFQERIKKHPELGGDFRIYETAKGIRVIGKKYVDPSSKKFESIMTNLGVDWLYIQLSKKQKCYRARLSPKPYRMKAKTMKIKSPLDCQTYAYLKWEENYSNNSKNYSVVRLVKVLGNDFSNDPVIKKHDLISNLQANQKLA